MAGKSLNKVTLIGNLTRDPELKYTPSGTAVATIGLATNRSWTSPAGEAKEEVQYHRLVAWQKLAELAGKLLAKGRKIYCEGRLSYRTYTGKDGTEKSITEIIIDDFIILDSKGSTGSANFNESNGKSLESESDSDVPSEKGSEPSETISDDDIPF